MDQQRVEELKAAARANLAVIEEGASNPDIIKMEQKDGQSYMTISQEHWNRFHEAKQNVKAIRELLTAEQFGGEVKAFLDNPAAQSVAQGVNAMNHMGQQMGVKDLGTAFIESAEFKSLVKSGLFTMPQAYELDTYDVASQGWGKKDIYSGLGSSNVPVGVGTVVQFDPTVPRGQRINRVRDLFPVAVTNSNLIEFFRVTGFTDNSGKGNAAPVPDYSGGNFGLKPKSQLAFESDQAPVRTIAHWEAAHRNILQDTPQLQSTINNELLYGLALEEDDQILNGDGTGDNLLGILNTPGIQSYTAPGAEIKPDSVRRAATLATLAYYPPTGYVIHPNDWEDIELTKGSTSAGGGDGQYMLVTNVAIGASAQIWRLPVVESPAISEGTFLTGAFGTGFQLYDRARASVRIAEQHADFFVRNAVAVLVEERLALAGKRPEAMVMGAFA